MEKKTNENSNYEKNPETLSLRMEYLIKYSKIYDLFKKLHNILIVLELILENYIMLI